jgi:hypothetical protein
MRTKTLLVFFFLYSTLLSAQVRDRATVWHQGLSSDSGERNLSEAWVSERWLLDEDGTGLFQFGVQARRTELPQSDLLPDDVWMIVPQGNLLYSIDETYSLIANLRVGAFSDLQKMGRDDFRIEGAVVIDRFISDRLTVGGGLGRVSNFGRVIFVPLVHIVWSISERWLLDAMLPGRLDLMYLPTPKLEAGLSFNILGSRYAIESDERKIDSLGVAQMNLGPVVRYQIAPSVYLTAESGVAFARRLSLMDENTEIREFSPNNEIYLRTGLQYRF